MIDLSAVTGSVTDVLVVPEDKTPKVTIEINGDLLDAEAARGHDAFFLARMYTAGKEWDTAREWYLRCEELIPGEKYAAPFWRWHAIRTLDACGMTAAMQVVDRGLSYWPLHADLWQVRIGLDLIAFVRSVTDRKAMAGVPMASLSAIHGVQRAIEALALPVSIRIDGMEES